MRISVTCFECCKDTNYMDAETTFAALRDDALYTFKCSRGHEAQIVLQQMRFVVLAEVAVQAILDGYYREAVSSFSASLERLFEFFIEAAHLTKHGKSSEFYATWKLVRKQSERQLGMFLGLYLQETGNLPPVLAEDQIAFRNRVIHQGQIPSEAEAVAFGQAVIDVVHAVLVVMAKRYRKAVEDLIFNHSAAAASLAKARDGVGYMSHNMIYVLHLKGGESPKHLEDEIKNRRSAREGKQLIWATMPEN